MCANQTYLNRLVLADTRKVNFIFYFDSVNSL